ncbi:MAG: hypothetical protein LBB55_03755 [Zoogloeaceae bacterium]|jgi:hypothetical protein|nr:hypothetical protein [Zoogloeaceae bacterium]
MKQRVRWLRWIGVALLAAAVLLSWRHLSMFLASDDCLDSGGSYDYAMRACDYVMSYAASHPHIPFYRAWSFWLGVISSLAGLWAIGRSNGA